MGHGILLVDQDPFATARGNAFAATADRPSAILFNPAGITQLSGHQVQFGGYAITYHSTFRSPGGAQANSRQAFEALPQFYYTYRPERGPLAFGVGLYSPFGLSMKWPETTGFRSVALDGRVEYLTLSPVVAWQIFGGSSRREEAHANAERGMRNTELKSEPPHVGCYQGPSLSIAFGPTFNYAKTDLRQGLSAVPGNDFFRFKGDDTDVGYTAALRWQPLAEHAFGVTYRSATTLNYHGRTETVSVAPAFALTQAASARFPFPQTLGMGWSWRPAPEWNLEFNANWTDWSVLKTVPIAQATPVPPLALNWESSWHFCWGATRQFEKGWHASAGYIYSQNSVPSVNFTPLVPDTDRHAWSMGFGRQWGAWSADAGYQFTWGTPRVVSGSAPSPAGQSADGRYEFFAHAFTVSVGRKF